MLRLLTRRRIAPLTRTRSYSLYSDADDPPFSPIAKPPKPKIKREKEPLNSQKAHNFPVKSDLPFDFRYSYSESDPAVDPIGFREPPRFSPFGPGRLGRKWTGTCAPVEGGGERERWEEHKKRVLGEPLMEQEVAELVEKYRHSDCNRQINIGNFSLLCLWRNWLILVFIGVYLLEIFSCPFDCVDEMWFFSWFITFWLGFWNVN